MLAEYAMPEDEKSSGRNENNVLKAASSFTSSPVQDLIHHVVAVGAIDVCCIAVCKAVLFGG